MTTSAPAPAPGGRVRRRLANLRWSASFEVRSRARDLARWWHARATWGQGCDQHDWVGSPSWTRLGAWLAALFHLAVCEGRPRGPVGVTRLRRLCTMPRCKFAFAPHEEHGRWGKWWP